MEYAPASPEPPLIWLVRSAMCDLMPPTDGLPGIVDTNIDAFLAQTRREVPALVWITVLLGALTFVVSPLITVYVPLPTFLLPATLRNTHAERVYGRVPYPPRQAMFLLKMYACMCWGQDPLVRERFALAPYPADPGTYRTT